MTIPRFHTASKPAKFRFCLKCIQNSKKFKVEDEMIRQAREGLWICPEANEECGKKVE